MRQSSTCLCILGTPNAPAASLRTGDPAVSGTATQFAVGGPATKRVRTFRRVGVRVTGKEAADRWAPRATESHRLLAQMPGSGIYG
jgi:hypothetical protein